ncbi:MAG TPA: hypothetical protein VN048_13910 [Verrucomicrobiae bacterium]|jgi:hypothetical protein|nr:hypothetical protein [Verrucomicrobiae bacterium]
MLTPLEKAVLDLMVDKPGEPFETVRQQLAYVRFANRKTTGVGFFTHFVVPVDAPVRRDLPNMEITGISASFPDVQHGAGFILFIRDGVVSFLEGFTYDDPWPEKTDEFTLSKVGVSK